MEVFFFFLPPTVAICQKKLEWIFWLVIQGEIARLGFFCACFGGGGGGGGGGGVTYILF